MTPNDVIKHYDGSIPFAAYNLGFSDQAVRHWVTKKCIPHKTQRLIEAVSGGKLKADKKVKK